MFKVGQCVWRQLHYKSERNCRIGRGVGLQSPNSDTMITAHIERAIVLPDRCPILYPRIPHGIEAKNLEGVISQADNLTGE